MWFNIKPRTVAFLIVFMEKENHGPDRGEGQRDSGEEKIDRKKSRKKRWMQGYRTQRQ